MTEIDVIALDLDGTALLPNNTVSNETKRAVKNAREAGIHVVIATGRICSEAREFAQQIGADDTMVTSGGAALSSVRYADNTMRVSIPWELAVRAAAIVERIGMTAMVYVGNTLIVTAHDDKIFGQYKSNEGYLAAKRVVESTSECIANEKLSVDKIFVRSKDSNMLENAKKQLQEILGIRVMSSAKDNLEIISPIADKGMALSMLCRSYGTDISRAAAIGDSENDLEMLKAVCLPIAMGNAADTVKEICEFVTEDNANDGVAKAIDKIVANKKKGIA